MLHVIIIAIMLLKSRVSIDFHIDDWYNKR